MTDLLYPATFRYETYRAGTREENMLVRGTYDIPHAVIISPLFAEMNFTRAIINDVARRLLGAGIGTSIPDLPGTGESIDLLASTDWCAWRDAANAAVDAVRERSGRKPHLISVRGGALLDAECDAVSWWRFAPATGAALLRHMERAHMIGKSHDKAHEEPNPGSAVELVGYRIYPALIEAMRGAEPVPPAGPLKSVPFEGPGIAPWRKAEPSGNPALACSMAADAASWIFQCER